MTTTTESRAGFTPAPPSPLKVESTNGVGGGGGFSFSQVAAQRAIIARAEARKPKRVDAEWGRE